MRFTLNLTYIYLSLSANLKLDSLYVMGNLFVTQYRIPRASMKHLGDACLQIKIVRYLLELKPAINISADNNKAFRDACKIRLVHSRNTRTV